MPLRFVQTLSSILLAFWLLLQNVVSAESSPNLRVRWQLSQPSITCRVTIIETMLAGPTTRHDKQTACIPIFNGSQSKNIFPISLPREISETHKVLIAKGNLFVSIVGGTINQGHIVLAENAHIKVTSNPFQKERKLNEPAKGKFSIAVVRISTLDSTPRFTQEQLKNGLFGTGLHNDGTTMSSQYDACSHGKLTWTLAEAGVIEVFVNQWVNYFNDGTYGQSLVFAAENQLAHMGYSNLTAIADKVLMCLPPGTGDDWVASAGIGHWRAQFNDEWCLSLSATMHEVGHLLGLEHSNRLGEVYQDFTGYMAAGYPDANWPKKCFNGHKNWLLGWYKSRHLKMDPVRKEPKLFKLAAFVDYDRADKDESVVVNIMDRYFLQYNRAKSFNINVEDERDRVTVIMPDGVESDLRRGLSAGERYEVINFQGSGKTLVIEACEEIRSSSSTKADVMVVSVGMGTSLCGQAFLAEAKTPNSQAKPAPKKSPKRAPAKSPKAAPKPPKKSPRNAPKKSPRTAPKAKRKKTHQKAPKKTPRAAPKKSPKRASKKSPRAKAANKKSTKKAHAKTPKEVPTKAPPKKSPRKGPIKQPKQANKKPKKASSRENKMFGVDVTVPDP